MKRYIMISIISSVILLNSCSSKDSDNTEIVKQDITMLKDEPYIISKGQTIIKNKDNTIVQLYSRNNGITTAILVSGGASIK